MTSRRKAKRADFYDVWENCFMSDTGEPVGFDIPWYWKRRGRLLHKRRAGEVEAMWGCVKKSTQNKRGNWNGRSTDHGYRLGYLSWKRD